MRLVLVHEHELLGSEQRQFKRLVNTLSGKVDSIDASSASKKEKVFLHEVFRNPDVKEALPAQWTKYQMVIALRILPPRNLGKGKRASEGIGDVLIFHPPGNEPLLSVIVRPGKERFPGVPGRGFVGKSRGQWILEHIAMMKQEAKP